MKKLFIKVSEWDNFKALAIKAGEMFQYEWNKAATKAEVLISKSFCQEYGY